MGLILNIIGPLDNLLQYSSTWAGAAARAGLGFHLSNIGLIICAHSNPVLVFDVFVFLFVLFQDIYTCTCINTKTHYIWHFRSFLIILVQLNQAKCMCNYTHTKNNSHIPKKLIQSKTKMRSTLIIFHSPNQTCYLNKMCLIDNIFTLFEMCDNETCFVGLWRFSCRYPRKVVLPLSQNISIFLLFKLFLLQL